MIHKLQKQWYIWPEQSPFEPKVVDKARRWDKVIGLVPQSACLFKIFYYQTDLIPQKEVRQCIDNELYQLVDWPECQYHAWINKVQDRWQVAVWFWDASQVVFSQSVTHIIPAMACELGKVHSQAGILLYSEGQGAHQKSWAMTWHNGKVIEQLYPLNSPLHQRTVVGRIQQQEHVYANHAHTLLESTVLEELNIVPRSSVLAEGKCSNQFDLDNPWQHWRSMLVLILGVLLYMIADASIISFKQKNITEDISQLQQETSRLQNQRAEMQDMTRVLAQIEQAKLRQQAAVKLIDALTTELASDIVIERLSYATDKMVLQGTIKDSVGLLETLSSLKGVKQARLLGEVVPSGDDRQEFRAELTLLGDE